MMMTSVRKIFVAVLTKAGITLPNLAATRTMGHLSGSDAGGADRINVAPGPVLRAPVSVFGDRLRPFRSGVLQFVWVMAISVVITPAWMGEAAAANTGCNEADNIANCTDVPEDGINYFSLVPPLFGLFPVDTVNVGDGVEGETVVNPGVTGIRLEQIALFGADADANAEFQILEDYDIDPGAGVTLADVVSADGVNPQLVEGNFIISDGAAEPTYTIGADSFTGGELAEFLAATSTDDGASVTASLTVNNNVDINGPVADAGAPFTTTNAGGIDAKSIGGNGGSGGCTTILLATWCDDGDNGGNAGSVAVNSNSAITVNGTAEGIHGIMAISQGGNGGNGGGAFGLFVSDAGGGGNGGDGGTVFVTLGLDSDITTHGAESHGVFARSRGGDGGSGGHPTGAGALGDDGGNGGDAGNVIVDNDGSILTTGWNSHGVYATSVGAGAGSGSSAGGIYAEGGNGGGESDGAEVTINNSGSVVTQNADSFGLLAQSIGGGGGDGGGAGGWFTVGGRGGSGGNSDIVTILDSGIVKTGGDRSTAIFAQSIGGGGGNGGDAVSIGDVVTVAVGGSGGPGGDGHEVYVTTTEGSDIDTGGSDSHGIHAQSIGGGGGNGGLAISGTTPSNSPIHLSFTLGGSGGDGGDAGEMVSVDTSSDTTIHTSGNRSQGIAAQSIGGGGGSGGTALSGSGGGGLSVSLSIGGSGGKGGAGKTVAIDNAATITTGGDFSAGIFTQSIGGGGGDGGFAGSLAAGGVSASVSLGGSGSDGGIGGAIDVDNIGIITTGGNGAAGIFAQSIGGGGGNGGSAFAGSIGVASASVTVGGTGGAGNDGGLVDILNAGLVTTLGHNSAGIFAQSIGGGGGNGGDATSLALAGPVAVAVAVGGDAGAGGAGGNVVATNESTGVIHTEGVTSDGVFAQSVGGSGGAGGSATTGTLVFPIEVEDVEIPAISANVSVGGRGAGGGTTGTVTVDNYGAIETSGFLSNGVFAQSVGGSGGRGGHATNISLAFDATFTGKVAVGGSGGQGGTGNTVTVGNYGLIHTQSAFSSGVFAQSVGGGGGTGGNATNVSLSLTPPPTAPEDFIPTPSMDFDLAIGGNGGGGAFGGDVDVTNKGTIITEGNFSTGVMAQSVGGAGGTGGDARTIQVELTADPLDFLPLTDLTSLDETLVFGGTGGDGSYGGNVTVTNESEVTTSGAFSHGIVAQSVGGGGGSGGSAMTFEFSNADVVPDIPVLDDISGLTTIEMTLQGSGGAGGDGGDVTLKSIGNIWTEGDFAMGIVAQSVAGGGGLAGFFNPHGIINNEIGDALFNMFVDTDAGLSFAGSVGGAGTAGDVSVDHTGDIHTLGDGAHGLFAQSAAGLGAAGTVDITLDGSITAPGDHAYGIYAQSGGGSGNGDITLTIEDGGVVTGGTGMGAGVVVSGGADNELFNYGTVTSVPGVYGRAMVATGGDESVDNYGTVTGDVLLGTGSNAFNNRQDARFNTGEVVVLGAGNALNNQGTVSPGAEGITLVTDLDGDVVQTASGTYDVDLDLLTELTDRITATGSADLAGLVRINPVNPGYAKPGNEQYTILSAAAGVTDSGLDVLPLAVVDYQLRYPNSTDVVLSSSIDFAADGLNRNQTAIGNHVNAIQRVGGSASFSPIAAALFGQPDVKSLSAAYDQLSPEVYLDTSITSVFSNLQFNDAMHSCRERGGDYRFVREGECRWMRVSTRRLDRNHTKENSNFKEWAYSLAGGMQKAINERWHAGFALSYERSDLDNDNGAKSNGDQIQGGVILKGRSVATTYSVAMSGGYGWYDTNRDINFLPSPERAKGDQKIAFASAHVRLGHVIEQGAWYLRPQIDAGITYVDLDNLSESRAGGANLDIKGHDETYSSVQPAVEAGGEFKWRDGTLLRPFAKVGFTRFLDDTSPEITAGFQGAPAGVSPFTVKGKVDRTFTDVSAGLDLLKENGINLRLNYMGQFSGDMKHHSVGFKVTVPF